MRTTVSYFLYGFILVVFIISCTKDIGMVNETNNKQVPSPPPPVNKNEKFAGQYLCFRHLSIMAYGVHENDTSIMEFIASINYGDSLFFKSASTPNYKSVKFTVLTDSTWKAGTWIDRNQTNGKFYSTNGSTIDSVSGYLQYGTTGSLYFNGEK